MEDSISLKEVHCTENVVYEARDDTTGVSFDKNGKREWLPIVGQRDAPSRIEEMPENCLL